MEPKDFVSVICEYNPFHFGHKYQMDELKKNFSGIVCILSGDIVQRGEAAVASKYLRAEAALKSGANLVLELPVPWCCASARDFALAGVHIAENIGSGFLAFGAEDEGEPVSEIYRFVSRKDFHEKLDFLLKSSKNLSYPSALSMLVKEELGEDFAAAVSKPNNILALEYLSALEGSGISPYFVKRNGEYASSSSIRALGEGERMLSALPEESKRVFLSELGKDFPRDISRLDGFILSTLRRMYYETKPSDIYSAPQDLVNRLAEESRNCNSFATLTEKCTNKVYTSARVRRAVLSVVFGIKSQRVRSMPPYTCVLAADKTGREILKQAKRHSEIEIITKPSKALALSEEVKSAYLFSKSIEEVIALTAPKPMPAGLGKTPVII